MKMEAATQQIEEATQLVALAREAASSAEKGRARKHTPHRTATQQKRREMIGKIRKTRQKKKRKKKKYLAHVLLAIEAPLIEALLRLHVRRRESVVPSDLTKLFLLQPQTLP